MVHTDESEENKEYRPLLRINPCDKEKITRAANLTHRSINKFIEKSALDCAETIIHNHREAGVEEALIDKQ